MCRSILQKTATYGSYAVVYHCPTQIRIRIGSLGEIAFFKGFYIYVGSAMGPGGLQARVKRHFQKSKRRMHWHIDYISNAMDVWSAYICTDPTNQEHNWAHQLQTFDDTSVVASIGCSDCRCASHLFHRWVLPDESFFKDITPVPRLKWDPGKPFPIAPWTETEVGI